MRAAAYCGTRNLYSDMVTAAKSLLMNSNVDKIYFIIEDDEFPYELPSDIFEIISVKDQTYFLPGSPNYKNSWTYMVLIRAALSKILPQEVDKVLSLDVDTIVDKDISELWDLDLSNYYLAAVREPFKSNGSRLYINFGVTMLNLQKLRETHKDDEIIHALNVKYYYANEQDCFNDLCQGFMYLLPGDYNVSNFTSKPITEEKIIHYAGLRYWNDFSSVKKYRDLSFEAIEVVRNARYNNSNL